MSGEKRLAMIAAIGPDLELGSGGDLVWHISADLKNFKKLTMGHPVIMGRKTWESLPKRPLPGRVNVVITRQPDYTAEGALVAGSLPEALSLLPEGSADPFIIGGGSLYAEALPTASRLYLTRIEDDAPQADTWFPEIKPEEWQPEEISPEMKTEINGKEITYRFENYIRKSPENPND